LFLAAAVQLSLESMMLNRLRFQNGLLVAAAILIAVLLLGAWIMLREPRAQGQNWVVLSVPGVEFQTNAGVAAPLAVVRVSNNGPGAVDFRLSWFECRSKGQKTLLATNRFASAINTLGPGGSTNLVMEIVAVELPAADYWCCSEVLWAERESVVHGWHRKLDRLMNLLDVTKNPRWYSKELLQGTAIAGNVDPADYFRVMYGKSRSEWLVLARKWPSLMERPVNNLIYFPSSSDRAPEENARLQAESAFAVFCRGSANSVPK
jgi:hypothetical protein